MDFVKKYITCNLLKYLSGLLILIQLGSCDIDTSTLGSQKKETGGEVNQPQPAEPVQDNSEELKQILELTKLISEIDASVSDILNEYDVIKLTGGPGSENTKNKSSILDDLEYIKRKANADKEKIRTLNKKLEQFSSENADIQRIKEQYASLSRSNAQKTDDLIKKIEELREEILYRDKTIEIQNEKLAKNARTMSRQSEIIKELNKKHLILFSKKKTVHTIIEGNEIILPVKEKKINIISYHFKNSFFISQNKDKETVIKIIDNELFWGDNNYLIVYSKTNKID